MNETETEAKGNSAFSKFLLPGVAVVVAIAVGAWVFVGGGEDDVVLPVSEFSVLGVTDDFRPEVGQLAPDFVLVDARDPNKVIRLSDFRGTPVVLNWYASWCGPCRLEIPDFKAAYETFDGDLIFLGVNLQESAEKAAGLMDEFEATWPIVLDQDGSVFAHYRGIGMPTTLFIDADGIIVESGSGLVTEGALVTALAKLGLDYALSAEIPEGGTSTLLIILVTAGVVVVVVAGAGFWRLRRRSQATLSGPGD